MYDVRLQSIYLSRSKKITYINLTHMKNFNKLKITIALFICAFVSSAEAQQLKTVQEKFANYTWSQPQYSHTDYFSGMAAEMKLSPKSGMQQIQAIKGANGYSHFRYQQEYQGLPVIANEYILHEKNGKVYAANGLFTPGLALDVSPAVSVSIAERTAREHLLGEISKSAPKVLAFSTIDLIHPASLCVIDAAYPRSSGIMKLAYQLDLSVEKPLKKMTYYIDAHSGALIAVTNRIHEHGVPGQLVTRYYGTQIGTVDSLQPTQFVLRDITRGSGITVETPSGEYFSSTSNLFDLKSSENRDEAGLDAYYISQHYFDFLKNSYGRNGLDDIGMAPKIRIHMNEAGRVNAYWDGEYGNFGDGDCVYGPLVNAEVVAHEFTHGLTEKTSGLIYQGESGALNESISDMFGKAFEYMLDRDNFTWILGKTLYLSPDAQPIRVMNDPNSLFQPAMYKGLYWEDDADVHYNSAVGNLWFVYLVEGKSGTNEAGTTYDVKGIGMLEALQIAYAANTYYNTPSTSYNQFYLNTVAAAEELHGAGSEIVNSVKEAWKAVGLPDNTQSSLKYDLAVTSELNYFRICGSTEPIIKYLTIENLGSEKYDSISRAQIYIYRNDQLIASSFITKSLNAGESLTMPYSIENEFTFDSYRFEVVYIDDENLANNTFYQFVEFSDYSIKNLRLDIFPTSVTSCKNQKFYIPALIQNIGCDTISSGSSANLNLIDSDNNILHSTQINFTKPFIPGDYQFFNFDVENGIDATQTLVLRLDFDGDSDPTNNISGDIFLVAPTISDEFSEGFDTWPSSAVVKNILSPFLTPDTVFYQNNVMLGFTGSNQDTFNRQRCLGAGSLFSNENYLSTNGFDFCVDYSEFSSSLKLSFDLALFRNYLNEFNPYGFSSLVKVDWTGSETGSKLFYNQPEGAVVNHEIPLPDRFKGTITFTTFTELGLGVSNIGQIDLSRYDVVLLDNLKVSSTSKVKKYSYGDLSLFPNPATNQIQIQLNKNFSLLALEIHDLNGNKVLQSERVNTLLDISSLHPGVYFIIATDNEQNRHMAKFIISR